MLGLFFFSGLFSALIGIVALVCFFLFLKKRSYILTTIMFVLAIPFFYWSYFVFDVLRDFDPY